MLPVTQGRKESHDGKSKSRRISDSCMCPNTLDRLANVKMVPIKLIAGYYNKRDMGHLKRTPLPPLRVCEPDK